MRRFSSLLSLILALLFAAGCATRQEVVLVKGTVGKKITTVAQMPADGNSSEMDQFLASALTQEGLTQKPAVAAGAQRSPGVDAIVSYVDVWRWDLAMYLHSIAVRLFDAESGALLAVGQWFDSPLHGFRDARQVVRGVVAEMMAKVRTATRAE